MSEESVIFNFRANLTISKHALIAQSGGVAPTCTRRRSPMDLFSDSSDAEDEKEAAPRAKPSSSGVVEKPKESFGFNKSYAARFEKRHQAQELARLKARYGDQSSDDESTEDEDAELLTPGIDMQIFRTIDKIRNK